MSMTITLKQIVDSRDALMNLSQQKLPIKISYNVSKVIRKANTELEHLTEVRNGVIKRYAPEGTEMTPEINQNIMNELNEVLETETEIPVNKIDLSQVHGLEMSARDILLLEPFCEFEDNQLM